jgi:hypothetical protein
MPDDWLWALYKIYIVIGKNGIYVSCAPHRGDMPMSLSKRPAPERLSSYLVVATLLIAVIAASLHRCMDRVASGAVATTTLNNR